METISLLLTQGNIFQKLLMGFWLLCTITFYVTLVYIMYLIISDTIKKTITKISL